MRTNKVHDFLHSVALWIFLLTMLAAAVLTLPRIATLTTEPAALAQCPAGSHQTAGQCIPDVVHAAEETDTTAEDVAVEGTDVLPVSFHEAPHDLWNALRDQHPAAYDDDVPGIGTFWIEVGTVVDVPGGLYLATLDGWFTCTDWETTGEECGANESGEVVVVSTDIEPVPATVIYGADDLGPCSTDAQCAALDADRALAGLVKADELDAPAYGTEQDAAQVLNVAHETSIGDSGDRQQMCKAARLILARDQSDRPMFEDWTWHGAPRVVGAQNDALLDAFQDSGRRNASKWLARFVKGCGGTDRAVRA